MSIAASSYAHQVVEHGWNGLMSNAMPNSGLPIFVVGGISR